MLRFIFTVTAIVSMMAGSVRAAPEQHKWSAPDVTLTEQIPDRWDLAESKSLDDDAGHFLFFKDTRAESHVVIFVGNRARFPDVKYLEWQAAMFSGIRSEYFKGFVPHVVKETQYVLDDSEGVRWNGHGIWLRAEHNDRFIDLAAPVIANRDWWICVVMVNGGDPVNHRTAMEAVVGVISVTSR